MNEQQIIEAALEDGGMPSAQAAAYRLLLQHAARFSAMENLEKEEASGGRTAATPSPDATIEEHCRKLLAIAHEDEIAMKDPDWLTSSELVGMANYLNKLFELSGAKSNKGEAPCATGNVTFSGPAPESGLDPRVDEISRGHDGKWRACGRDHRGRVIFLGEAANLADLVGTSYPALTQRMATLEALNVRLMDERNEALRERDSAQAEADRLLRIKRRLREELDATRVDCKAMRSKLDTAAMVRQFNRKFGVPIASVPAFPARERMNLRVRLIAEEFCEFLAALGHFGFKVDIDGIFYKDSKALHHHDLIAAADGLADLQYVIEGAALEFGIPLAAVFAEVHRSNMTKTGLPDSGGKIAKGDGYGPPQIERILREHGWEG